MMNGLRVVIVAVGLMGMMAAAWAAGNEPYRRISSSELKMLMDRQEKDLVIIDSRSSAEYQEAHINGAINVPLAEQERSPSSLDHAKESKVVFYCNGFT